MPEAADYIPWGVRAIRAHSQRYVLLQNYFDGDHRLVFASAKFNEAFGALFQAFALNMCPSVVSAVAERMEVQAWDGAGSEQAQTLYEDGGLDLVFEEIHEQGLTKGDVVVIVEEDADGVPQAYVQDTEHVALRYDPTRPGTLEAVVKVWRHGLPDPAADNERTRWRLNVYLRDATYRYVTTTTVTSLPDKPDGWVPFTEDEGGERVAHPLPDEMPVFHYGNRARLGKLGRSELTDVIPVQDWLNKTVADMLVGMEFVALPQRWATGLEVDEDPETPGRPARKPLGAADAVWSNPNDQGAFGQFPGADLSQFLGVIKEAKQSVAQVTGTPTHYLALEGEFPSGESLKTAEARLVKRVKRCHRIFGARHTDLLSYLARMGGTTLGDDLEPVWASAETRNEQAEADTVETKKRIGISGKQALRELGYTDEEIAEMEEDKQADAEAFAQASLAAVDRAAPVSTSQGRAIGNLSTPPGTE